MYSNKTVPRSVGVACRVRGLGWTDIGLVYCKGLFLDHFFLQSSLMTYIDEEALYKMFKFDDDKNSQLSKNITNDIRSIQRTLGKLVAWVTGWEVEFNVNK